ncbi:lysozyme inhibitor LprI family protein, partial [Elstera sp.]|uniref:lysozyme inhibitor LprI family protein n=1 Tax=Elstera sp. TaxID=1916664 RepID=UPI0037BE4487
MRRVTVRAVGLLGVGLWTGGGFFGPAQAASFDCAKAKAPIELLICATPAVNALDDRLKVTLDAAVKRAGDGRVALLADHKRWLAEFPKTCNVTPPPVSPTVVTCVAAAYEQHLAQLAPAAPSTAPVVAVPSQPIPGPVVKLDHAQLPASGTQSTYFSVDGPGRITVRAESATGVALRLVDMVAGPLAEAGEPGERDGRIDALLDRGRYKLILNGADKATGTVALTVSSTSELNQPLPVLAHDSGQTLTDSLGEGQQRSYWLTVGS